MSTIERSQPTTPNLPPNIPSDGNEKGGSSKEKKKGKGPMVATIAGLAGVALAAGVTFNVVSANNDSKKGPEKDPATNGQENPGYNDGDILNGNEDQPKPNQVEIDPHKFDVGANATSEQIGESHRGVTEAVISTLLNQSDYDSFINDKTGMTSGEFSRSIAEKRIADIFDAQWVEGWRDNIVLLKRYEYLVDQAVLRWNNYEGGDSVTNTLELTSSQEVSRSADQIVLEIGMTEHYQGVPSDQNNGEYNSVERVTYKLVNGRWRVIDWLPISGDH